MTKTSPGMFIAFEGLDGVGKTTQSALLAQRLERLGISCLSVREPGGTPLGEKLRSILKSGECESPVAEFMLFSAARAELVTTVIRPALISGRHVIADRFVASSIAYQGHGEGLDLSMIQDVSNQVTGGLSPDLTIWLAMPLRTNLARIRANGEQNDHFEKRPDIFFENVLRGYRYQHLAAKPGSWITLDATKKCSEIAESVWRQLSTAGLLVHQASRPVHTKNQSS